MNWYAKQIVAWRNKMKPAPRKTNFEKVYGMRPGLYEFHSPALKLKRQIAEGTHPKTQKHPYSAEDFAVNAWSNLQSDFMHPNLLIVQSCAEVEEKTIYTHIEGRFVPKFDKAFYLEKQTVEISIDEDPEVN